MRERKRGTMEDARERSYLARIAAAQREYDATVGALPDMHAAERALDAQYPGAVFPLPKECEHYRLRAALWDEDEHVRAAAHTRLAAALDTLQQEWPDHPCWEGWGSN